jgi:hypothetical protein
VERSKIVPPNRITKRLRTRLPEPIGPYVHEPERYTRGQKS